MSILLDGETCGELLNLLLFPTACKKWYLKDEDNNSKGYSVIALVRGREFALGFAGI